MNAITLARRVDAIRVSPSTAAAQKARDLKAAGRDIIDLTVGEPDVDTPGEIKYRAISAIVDGDTKYTPVNGTVALRQAIQQDFSRRLDLKYGIDQICVGGGGKQILFLAMMATIDEGDEVIIPSPHWVSYPDMVMANGGKPVIVQCAEADRFKLTPPLLERAITPRTRWLVLNSPSNPTGVAYTASELVALGDVLSRHEQVMVLCDDIYDRIWYADFDARSIVSLVPSLASRTLVVNGVSKSHAMTGWRIGYGAGPKKLIDAINKLQSQSSSCPSSISQAAAVAALTGSQDSVQRMVDVYRTRCDTALDRLNAIDGIHCIKPDGAFYLFPNCSGVIGKRTPDGHQILNDLDFVIYLLERAGVACIHGAAYGLEPYFRLSIATSMDLLEEGCRRIRLACDELSTA